jgi:hypothetical protein
MNDTDIETLKNGIALLNRNVEQLDGAISNNAMEKAFLESSRGSMLSLISVAEARLKEAGALDEPEQLEFELV